jgi:4-aminobutyrate aminotransferase-like enzyme
MKTGIHSDTITDQMDSLFSSILTEQRRFDCLKDADSDKTPIMYEKLENLSNLRGRKTVFNYISSGRGHGPFTELVDGSVKYDLIGGIGVNLLGHSHPITIKACLEAATENTIMCGNLQPHPSSIEVMDKLIRNVSAKSKLNHFWYAGSGSFANDLALKLVWQKKEPRYGVICFKNSFAGRSVATQELTYNKNYREGMPESLKVDYVDFYDPSDPEESTKNTLQQLDDLIKNNPETYCSIMFEPVQGEGGVTPGSKEFFKKICEWGKKNDLYIWIDEVQTFARTTELFAFQAYELDEYVDVCTVGKALQCCGILYTEELNPRPGLIAGTFHGAIASLKASSKIITFLTEGNFYGDEGKMNHLANKCFTLINNLKSGSCEGLIGEINTFGTMISFEIGDKSKEFTWKFLKRLFEKGIIAFSAGVKPVRVRMLLPITLLDEHLEEVFSKVETVLLEMK